MNEFTTDFYAVDLTQPIRDQHSPKKNMEDLKRVFFNYQYAELTSEQPDYLGFKYNDVYIALKRFGDVAQVAVQRLSDRSIPEFVKNLIELNLNGILIHGEGSEETDELKRDHYRHRISEAMKNKK